MHRGRGGDPSWARKSDMMREPLRRAIPRLAAISICLPLLLGACSKTSDTGTTAGTDASTTTTGAAVNAGPTIAITEFKFDPDPSTVKVGQVVTWRNDGSAKHQVGQDAPPNQPRVFESQLIKNGETYVFTPTTAGTYKYICEIHPEKMKGVLTVTPAAA